jgi:propanol-preferring alcohol dehydrogenase
MKAGSYRAVQVSAPRKFELVERAVVPPPSGKVRIRVEACGVCHSDVLTVEGLFPNIVYPRVPGHEAVGKIDALGEGVEGWRVGQRVAVGYLGGPCFRCTPCRRGDFVSCLNQGISGVSHDGGYAEVMIANEHALAAVPDELSATEAAPLICAGITTYNALRNSPARPGDLVAIQGVGGLGHLGVQFARAMGFRVVAIERSTDRTDLARQLGAHHYINSEAEDPAAALQALGGATLILATAPSGKAMSPLIGGLIPRGRMVAVGVGVDSIDVDSAALVLSSRSVEGSLTGKAIDGEDTLAFSVLGKIRPLIETMPLEQAADAYARMMEGKARFRMVLVTGQ